MTRFHPEARSEDLQRSEPCMHTGHHQRQFQSVDMMILDLQGPYKECNAPDRVSLGFQDQSTYSRAKPEQSSMVRRKRSSEDAVDIDLSYFELYAMQKSYCSSV